MSVINQVLQDLEKRGVPRDPAQSLENSVRAVSRQAPSRWPLAIAVATVGIAATAWFLLDRPSRPVPVLSSVEGFTTRAPDMPAAPAMPPAAPEITMPVATLVAKTGLPASRLSFELNSLPRGISPLASAPRLPDGRPAALVLKAAPPPEGGKAAGTASKEAPVIAKAPAGTLPGSEGGAAGRFKQVSPQQQAENEFRRAVGLMQQGRVTEAMEGYARVLSIEPGHEAARQAMVGLLIESKQMGEAERHLKEALKINPKQAGFAMMLSRIQVERGDLGLAIETLEKALPYGQNFPDYRAFLAALLQRQSRHQEAIGHYQAAVRASPGSGVWLMGLGISLEAENRLAEARDAFQRARDSHSLNPELTAFVDQRLRQMH